MRKENKVEIKAINKSKENDLHLWLSTYGLITANRILEGYKIYLKPSELTFALKNQATFYHRLIKIPLKNIFNGIILQQIYDYQVYIKKLFVDYLLSGETTKSLEAPGALTREDIQTNKLSLLQLEEELAGCEKAHMQLIARSQRALKEQAQNWYNKLDDVTTQIYEHFQNQQINLAKEGILSNLLFLLIHEGQVGEKEWKQIEETLGLSSSLKVKEVITAAVANLASNGEEVESVLSQFTQDIADMTNRLRSYRSQFYELILKVTELINQLPEYKFDPIRIQKHKESLYFDRVLGENQ